MPGVAAIAPFLWTAYADATRRGDRILLVNTWLAALAALFLPNLGRLLPLSLAILAFAAFRSPLIPLANSMAFRALGGRPEGFAAIRLWGTIGYILSAVAAGVAMDRAGLRPGTHGGALAMAACGLIGWMGRRRDRVTLAAATLSDIREVLRDRRFQLLLAATALARVSFGPYQTFFTIHLEALGLSRAFAGTAWALAAGSELGVMLIWRRLAGMAAVRTWLVAALAAHALRWSLSMGAERPAALLLIQLTHALTFGVFYLASVQSVDALVPDGLRATAQGLFASLAFGVGSLLGSILAGLGFPRLGMRGLYAAAAAVAGLATAIYWGGTRDGELGRRTVSIAGAGRGA